MLRARLLLLVLACLGGCATTPPSSLVEVRAFADASASLGGYAELSRRYRDTYAREQPYLAPGADKLARAGDAARRASYDDFVSLQKALVRYMQTLSQLAADARYDFGTHLDDMATGIKSGTESGLIERHITAVTGVTRLLTRIASSGYQQRSVGAMVRDGDADVQALIDGMIVLTRLYAKTSENEKKTVLGTLDLELTTAPRGTDRLLLMLARVHLQEKTAQYRLLDKRYDLAEQGLARVAQGHLRLREHLHALTRDDTRVMLEGYANDLRVIHDGLRE